MAQSSLVGTGLGSYQVLAIRFATRVTSRSEVFLGYESYGEPDAELNMDYFLWVARNRSHTVVVDTGFSSAGGARRGRVATCPPIEALAALGVAPDSVSQVVLTHLHFDHTGHIGLFRNAEFLVQRQELSYWARLSESPGGIPPLGESDDLAMLERLGRQGRVRTLDGDTEIAPGIRTVRIGGHTPGLQVVCVAGASRNVILASDALHYYEQLERDWVFRVCDDAEGMRQGYEVLRRLAEESEAVLVAGHDPEVTRRFAFLGGSVEGIALEIA